MNTRLFYYGEGTCSTAFTFLNIKFAQLKLVAVDFFVVTHAADNDPTCQAAALVHAHPLYSIWPTCRHVFGDFSQDRFKEQELLNSKLPDADDDLEQCWKAYQSMAQLLHQDPDRFLPDGTQAFCYRHLQMCPIMDAIGLENDSGDLYHTESWQKLVDEGNHLAEGRDPCLEAPRDQKDSEVAQPNHGTVAAPAPTPATTDPTQLKEIGILVGGTTCVDMTGYGRGEGEAGRSMVAYNAFVTDALKHQAVSICCEISGLDEISYYSKRLGHMYHLIGVNVCPTGMGAGCQRMKLFIWGTHRWKAKHYGTASEFVRLFKFRRVMTGRDYFVASKKERYLEARQRAASLGNNFPAWPADSGPNNDEPAHIPTAYQLTTCQLMRCNDFQTSMHKAIGKRMVVQIDAVEGAEANSTQGLPTCWIGDLEQNEGWCSAGEVAPPMVTHGFFVDLLTDDCQAMIAKEHLLMTGENLFKLAIAMKIIGVLPGDLAWSRCLRNSKRRLQAN